MSQQAGKPRIEKLTALHAVGRFDCGEPALNAFLHLFALKNQQAGSSVTYIGVTGEDLIGYYSLTGGTVQVQDAPERLAKGLPRHPVPIALLARLAVDRRFQRQGFGAALLRDGLRRILVAADVVGIRAAVVHAKNEAAAAFYRHYGFDPFPDRPLMLYRLLKDIKARLLS